MECQKHDNRRTASDIFGTLAAALNQPLGIFVTAVIIDRALHECGERCASLRPITVDLKVRFSYTVPPEVDADPRSGRDIRTLVKTVMSIIRQVMGDAVAEVLADDPVITEILEGSEKWND